MLRCAAAAAAAAATAVAASTGRVSGRAAGWAPLGAPLALAASRETGDTWSTTGGSGNAGGSTGCAGEFRRRRLAGGVRACVDGAVAGWAGDGWYAGDTSYRVKAGASQAGSVIDGDGGLGAVCW
jgi:hypothetical protein